MSRALVTMFAILLAPSIFGEKWVQQYFYDENGKDLHITDLAFASAERGVAVGAIFNDEGRAKDFLALVTSDGGEHWAKVPLKEFPRSLFFLPESKNASLGWMVTENGIWLTEEAGRSWRKVSDQIGATKKLLGAPAGGVIDRVYFLDALHGFAIGGRKSVFESKDGGKTWVPVVPINAAEPSSEKAAKLTSEQKSEQEARLAYSAYTAMAFIGDNGIITGGLVPPQRTGYSGMPGWMEPEAAMKRAPARTLAFELDTQDGGMSWRASTAAAYGAITQIHLEADWGLSVWNYDDASEFASEAQRIPRQRSAKTGTSETVFRRSDRRVTDSQLFADGSAFLAAVEPVGKMRSAPIPGKVRILRANLSALRAAPDKQDKKAFLDDWTEMQVDYRAVANLVYLAGPDPEHMWAATDTGMILKLLK